MVSYLKVYKPLIQEKNEYDEEDERKNKKQNSAKNTSSNHRLCLILFGLLA
jgi:hypothetical protein